MFSKHLPEVGLPKCPQTVNEVEDNGAAVGTHRDADSPDRFFRPIAIRFWRLSLYYGTGLSDPPANVRFSPGQRSRSNRTRSARASPAPGSLFQPFLPGVGVNFRVPDEFPDFLFPDADLRIPPDGKIHSQTLADRQIEWAMRF